MKAVVLGPAFPMRGGITSFNESFSKELMKNGWDVINISYSHRFPRFLFPEKIPVEPGIRPLKLEIIPLIHCGGPLTWVRVARRLRVILPQLVLVHYWSPWLAPALGSILSLMKRKNGNTRFVAVVHHLPGKKTLLLSLLHRYFLRRSHGFIIMSKTLQEDLEQLAGPYPFKLVSHPVYRVFGEAVPKEEARAFLKLSRTEPLILFFGIVRPYKGLDLLLKALAMEEVRKLNLRLIVAGEFFEGKQGCIEMIRELHLANNVILQDSFIPTDEVKYYFSACDMVIQPYREASQSGITQIAYQFERPMLVTGVGNLAEIVPHMKVGYVAEVSPESVAAYIVDFYTNAREREFAVSLREEKKKYSWENMVKGLEDLLQEISPEEQPSG